MRSGKINVQGIISADTWERIYDNIIIGSISNGDIYIDEFTDISSWTDEDTGTAVSSQTTFDGKSCMSLYSGTNAGEADRSKDTGSMGATRTVVSFKLYCDKIGTNGDAFTFIAGNGTRGINFGFASDGLFCNAASAVEVGTNLVVQDVWQEWTFDINWSTQTCDVYLNKKLVGDNIDFTGASVKTDGYVLLKVDGYGAAGYNIQVYVDWFKAGSDFTPAGPGEIRGEQTSITISGLAGNTDEEYQLEARIVNGYNGGCNYKLRVNNDSGSNYGMQELYAYTTNKGAARSVLDYWEFQVAAVLGDVGQSKVIIHAKSGYVRTSILEYVKSVVGTTITLIRLAGQSWNNTADEITSLVILADQTNGLGVGSQITLWRRSKKV